MQSLKSLLFHRSVLVCVALLAQILVLGGLLVQFSEHTEIVYWVCILLSLSAVLWILISPGEPAYKIAWLIVILPFPVFGGVFYLLVGGTGASSYTMDKMKWIAHKSEDTLHSDFKADDLLVLGEDAAGQARYLEQKAGCPSYTNTDADYFPQGELGYASMLQALERAEKYILLEYFIIQEGEMWNTILAVLERKAAEGVEVRVLYDDIGCMFTLPRGFQENMAAKGIQCRVFNRFIPIVSIRLNNRDHRKMMIIDGVVAFTGGMNLADEYIGRVVKYGHWKDSLIRLEGDGVWSMTVMFLSMWDFTCGWDEDFRKFRPGEGTVRPWTGYVQPYVDAPLSRESVSQGVYLNLISRGRKYIYITTPYLITDIATTTALCNAAKMGVDVRIITPKIPDKRYVQAVTRAHYPPLLEAGVKIFEYTPGFIHCKNFVVDGVYATVGTVNMDYRSLFLHFENGVWLCEAPCIQEIATDFLETQKLSQPITLQSVRNENPIIRLYRNILRVFAPLL